MDRFRCCDCGKTFDDPKIVSEYRGECWGVPAYEDTPYCPYCGGDFEENTEDEDEEDDV